MEAAAEKLAKTAAEYDSAAVFGSCFHSAEEMPEFIKWSKNLAGTCIQLLRFFVGELPSAGPGSLWLQADGCYSRASWVMVEVSATGSAALARGW